MTLSDNLRGALYMVGAMAGFSLSDAGMKATTETLPVFEAIAVRGIFTCVLLVLLGTATQGFAARLSRRDAAVIALRSAAEIGATVFFFVALVHMPLANLSALLQALPLAVTLGAAVAFGERIGWRRMTAILVGFMGVLLIVRPGTDGFDRWSILGLASVACVVVRDLATRRLSPMVPSVTVALCASVAVTAMALLGCGFTGWQRITPAQGGVIGGISVVLIAGYMFGVMAMRVGDIGVIAPFRYTSLIWALCLGWLVFGTWPDGLTLIGAGIVIATGIFTLYRERKLAAVAHVAA